MASFGSASRSRSRRPGNPSSPGGATPGSQHFGYLVPALQDRPDCFLPYRADGNPDPGIQHLLKDLAQESDLPRDTAGRITGRALIGDPRNDDNPIVSQLHLAFAAFHNAVVDRLAPGIDDPYELFVAASTLVRQHFQWIVLNDFLRTIARSGAVDTALASPCNEFCRPGAPYVPVEFSMAAFRFGHSMVRPFYTMAEGRIALLDQMRRELTFRNPLTAGVPAGWTVDWTRFFWTPATRQAGANVAKKIDTHVTPGLATETTLLRAYAARVPSGQCVAAALHVPTLTDDDLRATHTGSVMEREAGLLTKKPPLWYYVLKEAEVVERGERLGPLGSRLVASPHRLRTSGRCVVGQPRALAAGPRRQPPRGMGARPPILSAGDAARRSARRPPPQGVGAGTHRLDPRAPRPLDSGPAALRGGARAEPNALRPRGRACGPRLCAREG
jgi:hypothetical protein